MTHIDGIVPLDDQFGSLSPLTCPASIQPALFGNLLPDQTVLGTFAILDAAKISGLPEMLEASGLAHQCLFRGDARDEYGEAAPWIVALAEDDRFTRNLFTRGEASWQMWDDAPGIYLRSAASLDALCDHFRHFTKVRDEADAWVYFRFWDPAVADVHLTYLANRPDDANVWTMLRGGGSIAAFLVLDPGGSLAIHTTLDQPERERSVFVLRSDETAAFKAARIRQSERAIARRLAPHAPGHDQTDLENTVRAVMARFGPAGFRNAASFFALAWFHLHHGPEFDTGLTDTQRAAIGDRQIDESQRIADLRAALLPLEKVAE